MGDFMIGDASGGKPEDDGAWKNKVKSLDDTLKSLRGGAPNARCWSDRQALEVSASGYYAWAARPDAPAERRRKEWVEALEEVQAEVRQRYGSPRMTALGRTR